MIFFHFFFIFFFLNQRAKKLLFAFSSDIDMVVSGSEFMHLLGCMPIYPKNY